MSLKIARKTICKNCTKNGKCNTYPDLYDDVPECVHKVEIDESFMKVKGMVCDNYHLKIRHIDAGRVFVYGGVPYMKIKSNFYTALNLHTYELSCLDVDLYVPIEENV